MEFSKEELELLAAVMAAEEQTLNFLSQKVPGLDVTEHRLKLLVLRQRMLEELKTLGPKAVE